MIKMRNIVKRYYIGQPNELEILHGMDIDIHEGEFVAIVGASGSGKSTLMNIIGALDKPTEGVYYLDDTDISKLNDKQLSDIRNKKIGFVFQTFNLISRQNALKNVELPMLYGGMSRKDRSKRAMELLKLVEMEDRYTHQPNELSGGQKQRVAIARAMANDPAIILADEPTGALDSKTGHLVMDIFHKLHKQEGKTIVLITHSPELASETERIITISDGMIISDSANPDAGKDIDLSDIDDFETDENGMQILPVGDDPMKNMQVLMKGGIRVTGEEDHR
ncbi:MAG: ABC transporter ATP-binding protein [Ruminococcus sp.]|nr:ABC transporter ATP-binding protein [Ruminococcus sp.]